MAIPVIRNGNDAIRFLSREPFKIISKPPIIPVIRTAEDAIKYLSRDGNMLPPPKPGGFSFPRISSRPFSSGSSSSFSGIAEAKKAFNSTSDRSEERSAFCEWLSFCSRTSEAREAFQSTSNSDLEDMAFDRWLELCSTADQAREAYRATSNSRREEKAKARITELGGEV